MTMTRVPHVGAIGTDTHGHKWTVTAWQLTDDMIHIARNTINGAITDLAATANGRWHVFGEDRNTITFPPIDVSRVTIDTTESGRSMSKDMERLGIDAGGVITRHGTNKTPRIEIDMSALAKLIELAKDARVIFSGDENGMQSNADGRRCELCTRSREVAYTTAAAAWLCVHCRDEFNIKTPETPELRLTVGDKFHTVTVGGTQEVWTYAGCRDGEYLIVQDHDGQEYTRVVELVNGTWRCVDDPDEFTSIVHMSPSIDE